MQNEYHIFGHSDDLVELDGDGHDEVSILRNPRVDIGETTLVAEYGVDGPEWSFDLIEQADNHDVIVRPAEEFGYNDYSPVVVIRTNEQIDNLEAHK